MNYIACQSTIVICPPEGCEINCYRSYACRYMKIYYEGDVSDGGSMNIVCSYDDNSCYQMEVLADTVDSIKMTCSGGTYISSYYYAACESATLNATYANNVTVIIDERNAAYLFTINAQEAGYVVLDAREGYYGFYASNLHAENAGKLVIYSQSDDSTNYPLRTSNYYVGEDVEINCYGYGMLQYAL